MSWGLSIEEAVKFHGHPGPWLLIGYRAGSIARSKLGPRDIHDLYCIVKVPNKVPYSCSIDGVQASACCTLGKGNIVTENGEDFEFVFVNRVSGDVLRLRLRKSVVVKLQSFKSLEEAFNYVMGLGDWELFELS